EARAILKDGRALVKFREIVHAQGGSDQISAEKLVTKAHQREIKATASGTITEINNYNLNSMAKILGAPNDKYAGLYLLKKTNDKVTKNETIAVFHSTNPYHLKEAADTLSTFPIFNIE
ncbi:hypothetical protein HGB07_01760, partial [Candidatus Roizmanbacteria bacterium]|nr:hypothetical protein [Candidatus Roizmanbacteria bacterium]